MIKSTAVGALWIGGFCAAFVALVALGEWHWWILALGFFLLFSWLLGALIRQNL